MNIRKGFFRLTLILSVLCGISTLCFRDDIRDVYPRGFRSRNINIMVPLPNDWGNRTLQQKLDSVYELLISSKTTVFVLREEAKESRAKWYGPKVAAEDAITALREATERLEKTTELMKKAKLKFLRRLTGTWGLPEFPWYYFDLTSREQQNVKRRLRDQIISYEKRLPKDREIRNYYVSSGPDWRELSFLVFIGFIIGFAPVWLIYAFTRWVIIAFIVRGFKGSSSKEGENDKNKGR